MTAENKREYTIVITYNFWGALEQLQGGLFSYMRNRFSDELIFDAATMFYLIVIKTFDFATFNFRTLYTRGISELHTEVHFSEYRPRTAKKNTPLNVQAYITKKKKKKMQYFDNSFINHLFLSQIQEYC